MRSQLQITVPLLALSWIGCSQGEAVLFEDVAGQVGIDFRFDRARDRDFFMPDSLAAGCAFLDYDADGDLDVYVVNGFRSRDGGLENPEGANRLYRQESDGTFTDVTDSSGAGDRGYGMGVAVGDFDNDGDVDLYLANYGPDALYRNRGDGTFVDVTRQAGLGDPRWAASAGFLDYDGDGFLDIFVTHYVDYDSDLRVTDSGGRPEYPGPMCCDGVTDSLYRNEGDGSFTDVTQQAGIATSRRKGLGVTFWDIDRDGRMDISVTNDAEPNNAWLQIEPGTFADRGLETGLALNMYGAAEASMGVAVGDLDGDLALELFVTHIARETNTLYQESGAGLFRDATIGSGLGAPSVDFTGFGTRLFDFDLDGDLDVLVVNGRVLRAPNPTDDHWAPYAEPNQLYENDGAGGFRDVSDRCGTLCSVADVSRGLAIGDVDGDGDPDALLCGGEGRVRLFRNLQDGGAHWLAVHPLVAPGGRLAHGAEVFVMVGSRRLRRDVSPAGGYLSSHDPRVRFGLGEARSVDDVRVRWPDGSSESFGSLAVDRVHTLVRGTGRSVEQGDLVQELQAATGAVEKRTTTPFFSNLMRITPSRAAVAVLALALAPGERRATGRPEIPLPPLDDAQPLVRARIEDAVETVRREPGSAASWGRLGEIYDVHRYVAEAMSSYARAQELEPDQWRWSYFAGLALRDSDSVTAQGHLARAVELRPDYAPAWFYLGLAALQSENLGGAEEYFRRALEIDPGLVNGSLGLARVALARGDPRTAIDLLERAARSAPDEAAVHEQRAQIYRLLGDAKQVEEAEQAARSAVVPSSVLGFASLSDPIREEVFMREGVSSMWLRHREATLAGAESVAADLRRAIEADPGSIEIRLALVRTLNRTGRVDEARQEVERALAVDPMHAETHAEMGNLMVRYGRAGLAEQAYRRALELDPDLQGTRATLGGLLVETGDVEEGIELLRAASGARPDNADMQHNLAAALMKAGRHDEAGPITVDLVERHPDYAPGLTLLGTLQALQGDLEASVASLRRALEIDRRDAEGRMELGRSLRDLGRYAEAIEEFERAVRDGPDDPETARELAWALATSPEDETRDGRKALEIARTICERSAFGNPMHLDVLAAAQAETGDFVSAGQTAARALQIVEQTVGGLGPGDDARAVLEEFADELRARLALYRSGTPYRQER